MSKAESTTSNHHPTGLFAAKRKVLLIAGGVLLLALIIGCVIFWRNQTQPSAATFCRVRQEEITRLSNLPKTTGYKYSTGAFPNVTASASEIVKSLSRLEPVATPAMQEHIRTLIDGYKQADQNPEAGFSTIYANNQLQIWAGQQCDQKQQNY